MLTRSLKSVTLRRPGTLGLWHEITVAYHTGGTFYPEVADVLYSLQVDVTACENSTLQEFIDDLGYGSTYITDLEHAKKVYEACKANEQKLKAWLGPDLYPVFMYCEE